MQARDEVGILFFCDNALELERKPTSLILAGELSLAFMRLTRGRSLLCPTLPRPVHVSRDIANARR